jgi:hypothetical protein
MFETQPCQCLILGHIEIDLDTLTNRAYVSLDRVLSFPIAGKNETEQAISAVQHVHAVLKEYLREFEVDAAQMGIQLND